MRALAQRIGGSGHAGRHLRDDFDDGHIPRVHEGYELRNATLNLVLEAGIVFRTPTKDTATIHYVARNNETYYLQAISLSVIDPSSRGPLYSVPGLIHRNRPHPPEFDHIVEVIAPDCSRFLRPGLKEWFELEGPFELLR